MDWISPLWQDLRSVLKVTWPEVTEVFRTTQIERRNWVRLIERQKLVAPWVTVYFPLSRPSTEWGVSNVAYLPEVTVYYIDGNKSNNDMGAYLEGKLIKLQDALLGFGWQTSQATLLTDQFATDVSDDNAVNRSMLDGDMPYQSGALTFSVVVGFIPGT